MSELTIVDYEEVLAGHRLLVRRLDWLLNGSGAAEQASLCDVVGQLERVGRYAPEVLAAIRVAMRGCSRVPEPQPERTPQSAADDVIRKS